MVSGVKISRCEKKVDMRDLLDTLSEEVDGDLAGAENLKIDDENVKPFLKFFFVVAFVGSIIPFIAVGATLRHRNGPLVVDGLTEYLANST